MKNKNPLYVVKGQNVEQAKGLWDLFVKKFDLEPVINFMMGFFQMLLEQVKTYPALVLVKNMLDEWISQILPKLQGFMGILNRA